MDTKRTFSIQLLNRNLSEVLSEHNGVGRPALSITVDNPWPWDKCRSTHAHGIGSVLMQLSWVFTVCLASMAPQVYVLDPESSNRGEL